MEPMDGVNEALGWAHAESNPALDAVFAEHDPLGIDPTSLLDPEDDAVAISALMDADPEHKALKLPARIATTQKLRDLAARARREGYNRQIPPELLEHLHSQGRHVISPLLYHHFIDGVAGPEHVRCHVYLATREMLVDREHPKEPIEVTMDLNESWLKRLPLLHPPKRTKADPVWDQVLQMYDDLMTNLKTRPPAISIEIDRRKVETLPLPPEFVTGLDPYYVESDCISLIELAASSMPEHTLAHEDMVSPTGFAVLERPLVMDVPTFGEVAIRAITWKPSPANTGAYWIFTFMDLAHELAPKLAHGVAENHVGRLWPGMHFEWKVGETVTAPLDWTNAEELEAETIVEFRKWLAAFWLLSSQRVTLVSGQKPVRGLRRAAERQGYISTILVVTLRRENPRTYEGGEPGHVEWSHRWVVSGHWRRIWSEKEARIRTVWVSPFIKGPADKPLIIKDKRYRFSR